MVPSIIVLAAVLGAGAPVDAVKVTAKIMNQSWGPGERGQIVIEIATGEGWMTTETGLSAPLLQINAPPSAKLLGKVLTSMTELRENEFVYSPYEKLLKESRTRLPFTLEKYPDEAEHFGLTVLGYVSKKGDKKGYFFRKRLELPLTSQAVAKEVEATDSSWGKLDVLQIGDKADDFELTSLEGKKVSLSQYLGKKNVIVSTYRAFW